jgi:hypothetical protein
MIITSPLLIGAILIMAAGMDYSTAMFCAAGAAGGNSGDLLEKKIWQIKEERKGCANA